MARDQNLAKGDDVMADSSEFRLVDARFELGADNIFRFNQTNGLPKISERAVVEDWYLTAAEVQAARVAKKKSKQ